MAQMMLEPPTRWFHRRINGMDPSECIFGLRYDPKILHCGFYFTNFEQVWVQELDRDELEGKAKRISIDDSGHATLLELLRSINKEIPHRLKFTISTECIVVDVPIGLDWKFELEQLQPAETINFLTELTYQQFAHSSYLNYKLQGLKSVVGAKDSYIRFLTMNFKQSHGDQAMKKYRLNHDDEAEGIDQFESDKWENRMRKEYRHVLESSGRSKHQQLGQIVQDAVSNDWDFANSVYQSHYNDDDDDIKQEEQDDEEKYAADDDESHQGSQVSPRKRSYHTLQNLTSRKRVGQLGSFQFNREGSDSDPEPPSIESSPMRRQKLGQIGKRRLKRDDSEAFLENSQSPSPSPSPARRAKKFGQL
ncbi:uncharacterized protein LODBEIA_P58240 [Lodderomyces beijingensis]|uniref:XLF-like N-terminal domain-containing protein n=1 Tax=Lodderomyces beijingensis TaxID=1775926 RepID=A0ABP0ZVV0_9ASCO